MSDVERDTVTSSSSHVEMVQPFTIAESLGLEVNIESPKLLDSSTLLCTSIEKSPKDMDKGLGPAKNSPNPMHFRNQANNFSYQLSRNNHVTVTDSSDSTDGSIGGGSSDPSGIYEDDFATNQSAKLTDAEMVSSGSSGNINTTDKANINDNRASEGVGEEGFPPAINDEETPNATDAIDAVDDSDTDAGHNSDAGHDDANQDSVDVPESDTGHEVDKKSRKSDDAGHDVFTTDAGSTGIQSTESTESSETGNQSDSVFANLADTAEAVSQRNFMRAGSKNEQLASLIEKAILDFCSSRTVETMRRMFSGVTVDTVTQQRDGVDKSSTTPHPVTGELVKEGVIIGAIDIFAPRMQKEYILPVRDSIISTFLKNPGVFRAICFRTRCQLEITRRLLNRKLCIGGRWRKFMIIRIVGPTYRSICNCDILLQKAVPDYKARRDYTTPAVCRMFLREDVPDNAELYHSFQRTGGTSHRFGALKLESPYRQTPNRSIVTCPWKFGLLKTGKLAFSCPSTRLCMKQVYPSVGYQTSGSLEPEYQGVYASNRVLALHEQFHLRRQNALSLKRTLTIPVCR